MEFIPRTGGASRRLELLIEKLELIGSDIIVFGGLELLHLAFTMVFMLVFVVMAFFTLYVTFRALRGPRRFYPPPGPSASLLVKELEPIGYYAIRCRGCGFTFSIGRAAAYPHYPGWWRLWFWPILWAWPAAWLEKG